LSLPVIQSNAHNVPKGEADQRPRFAIGHISFSAENVGVLRDFYTEIGMRLVVDMGRAVILELRGGTHLVIHTGMSGTGSLDLIVDDIDDTWKVLTAAGASPTAIERGHPHDRFSVLDPEGNALVVHSNHAIGVV